MSNDRLSFDDRHAAFVAGVEYGITRGRAATEADMDAAWAPAYAVVQAAARIKPHAQHWAAVRSRQEARCEQLKAEAVPWPDEDPYPSARVLNGWPDP